MEVFQPCFIPPVHETGVSVPCRQKKKPHRKCSEAAVHLSLFGSGGTECSYQTRRARVGTAFQLWERRNRRKSLWGNVSLLRGCQRHRCVAIHILFQWRCVLFSICEKIFHLNNFTGLGRCDSMKSFSTKRNKTRLQR
jgi:hypothetical protein